MIRFITIYSASTALAIVSPRLMMAIERIINLKLDYGRWIMLLAVGACTIITVLGIQAPYIYRSVLVVHWFIAVLVYLHIKTR
jgi:hypothetical protein